MITKETIKEITKAVFIAEDGTEFDREYECINYENEKQQEALEKECDAKLRIYPEANYPSMLNLNHEREYMLYLIRKEEDLDLFVKTFRYWFNNIEKKWEVSKDVFTYPEVICVLDFPKGGDETRLYRMTQLVYQFNSFVDEVQYICNRNIIQERVLQDDEI